jgi:cold shock CspA family protein
VATSPLVQATQEAIESLHHTAALWGRVFDSSASQRAQIDTQADAFAGVFLALNVAYEALPRFRTEPALRRFMEAMRELERSLRTIKAPALNAALEEVASAAAQGSRQAEAAFSAVSGKPIEQRETNRPVQGAVLKLLSDRGYGFVRQTGATAEVFFTAQSVRGARFGDLKVGQSVSFRVVPDPRVPGRMHAIEVQPIH